MVENMEKLLEKRRLLRYKQGRAGMSNDRLDNVLAMGYQGSSELLQQGNGEITFFQALRVLIGKMISAVVSAVFTVVKVVLWIVSVIRNQWKLELFSQRKDAYKKIHKVQSTLQQNWNVVTTRSVDGKVWASDNKPSLAKSEDVQGLDDIFPTQITSFFGEETRGLPVQDVSRLRATAKPKTSQPQQVVEKLIPQTVIQAAGMTIPDATMLEKMKKNGTSGEGEEDFTFQSMLQNNKILSRSIANLADSYFTRAAEEADEAEYLY